MIPVLLILAAAVAILAVGAWRVSRPPPARSGDLEMRRVVDGVWLYRGYFSNSAVLVLPAGVVVVDTQVSPLAAQRLRTAVEQVTKRPIRAVVNTHYHGDHTGGNALFPEAEIVATADCARYVVERDAERIEYATTFGLSFQAIHPTIPPTRTFQGRTELKVGDDTLELLQLGRVETPDACVLWWPARRVVCCGDGVATVDYPYLGVPFLDEGLRDDGSWIGFLRAIIELKPVALVPGHGPALVGEEVIRARLELLISLMTDLMGAVKRELAAATPPRELVEKVNRELRRYPGRKDLTEYTVSQRFAIYRCLNNLLPERKGKGWWHELRPSVVRRAPADQVAAELAGTRDPSSRAAELARRNAARPLAVALLEEWTRQHPDDAKAWAQLADIYFDSSAGVSPTVDATEFIALTAQAAQRALAVDPAVQLGLLHGGVVEVFGGMVLAQPMASGIAKLEAALEPGGLTRRQRQKALFFLGKAHQMERRDGESDRYFRRALPAWLRPLYPLLRARLRAYP